MDGTYFIRIHVQAGGRVYAFLNSNDERLFLSKRHGTDREIDAEYQVIR